jgi:hypothetical protein
MPALELVPCSSSSLHRPELPLKSSSSSDCNRAMFGTKAAVLGLLGYSDAPVPGERCLATSQVECGIHIEIEVFEQAGAITLHR